MVTEALKDQALVLVKEASTQQKIIQALEKLSLQTVVPSPDKDNIQEQINSMSFKVIVMEEGFQNKPLRENPLYQQLINMPMAMRRNTFVILVGKGIEHLNYLGSFSTNANLYLDPEKMGADLVSILEKEIYEYSKFYQVYHRVKEKISKGE